LTPLNIISNIFTHILYVVKRLGGGIEDRIKKTVDSRKRITKTRKSKNTKMGKGGKERIHHPLR
jgi:hypothetical protein